MSEDKDIRIVRVNGPVIENEDGQCGKMYLPKSWVGKQAVAELKEEADS